MKSQFKIVIVLFLVESVCGKTVPPHNTTPSPVGAEESTPAPWLKYLKGKKGSGTTNVPVSTESATPLPGGNKYPSLSHPPSNIQPKKPINSLRALECCNFATTTTSSPQVYDPMAQWLGIYVQPSGNALAEDRKANPGSFYDEVYLDWMKKRDVGDMTGSIPMSTSVDGGTLLSQIQPTPAVPVAPYGYQPLAYGFGLSPFYPYLASLKVQKAMMQGQVDAALAALDINTTPKPMKLKLKIQVPGNIDVAQLGQLTTALTNSLPAGSTYSFE